MKQLNNAILALMIFCISLSAKSQDPHLSQIFETPLLRNPSLAGLFKGDIRLQSVYRSQWGAVTVPYQTTSVSGEYKQKIGNGDDYITFGGQVLYDKAGTVALTTLEILPTLNYHKSISAYNNTYLSIGAMGGIIQRGFDRSKMTTNSQFDGTNYNSSLSDGEYMSKTSYSYFDGSVGMSLNSQIGENPDNNYFVGVAYHHFNKAKEVSFYESSNEVILPKWVVSSGMRLSMTDRSYFTLQADYTQQGSYTEIVGGALYSWRLQEEEDSKYLFHVGAYVRWNDAIIPVAKIEFGSIAIATSYDANISQLKKATKGQGGFEISLTYQKAKQNNSSLDAVKCPRF